jgi:uncharacterized protein (DUF305 family)
MMPMDAAAGLTRARPFDRAFIDEMVPHHQGAIRMARAVMDTTEDSPMERLAEGIVSAQSREVREMNEWRTKCYGRPSPAGRVPKPADGSREMEYKGHSA